MTTAEKWIACKDPQVGDVLRWKEPIWAAPSKPRGKPDQIGEQAISAEVSAIGETIELIVHSAKKISEGDIAMKVKAGDLIRRKPGSLVKGQCQKLVQE